MFGTLRYSLRQLRMAPVFTAAATLTLALGIGGTTAIFTMIHAVMLRSLPVADPALLFRVGDGTDCCVQSGPQERWGMFSWPLFERLKAAAPEFTEMAAFQSWGGRFSARRQGSPTPARPLRSEYVTGNYFSTLGVKAWGGRLFSGEDDKPSAAPVAVMSHQAWQTTYASDPSIVGATFVLEGHPFTVIGIAPPGFFGETLRGDPPDLWVPLQQEPMIAGDGTLLRQPSSAWLRAIGRLRPGATTAGMAPRLTGVLRQWLLHESGYPANWMPDVIRQLPKEIINVVPAGGGVEEMKEWYSRSLQILLAVCGMVLLIACANVANLMLARAVARRGQIAVRLAMGANRRQIVGQALAEAIVLAMAGGIAGLLVAVLAGRLLLSLAFSGSQFVPISPLPSPMVLAFAFAVSLLTGIVFGAAPAWFATRTDPVEALRGVGRSVGDRASFTRQALLVTQAALSIVLVAGATMLARSLDRLEHQNFGYPIDGRVMVSLNRPSTTYTLPRLQALYRRIEDDTNRLPGVRGSGLALYNPLTNNWGEMILVSGHPPPKFDEDGGASWDRVSADYLQNLGVGLVRGRYFTRADNENSELVAVVNEAFAKRFFGKNEDPIGQHFGLDLPQYDKTFRIVGIVRNARFAGYGYRRPFWPTFFVPLAQNVPYKDPLMTRVELQSHFIGGLMLTTNTPAGTLEPMLTRMLAGIDPDLTINTVRTLREQVERSFDQERTVASLAGVFGLVALVLAAVGLYGVTAYTVARRTNEIGIRMALGAGRRSVIGYVMRGALARVAIGLALGVPLAIGTGRLISNQLYEVSFWDPFALTLAAVALGVCAVIAAMIPAGVAASISPMDALRTE